MRLEEKLQYARSTGKAMHGYNHFFAPRLSAEFAGRVPGIAHGALWAKTCTRGAKAKIEDIDDTEDLVAAARGSRHSRNGGVEGEM